MTSGSGGRTDATARLEAFLSAGLKEEPNGMTLSVVSALARLDLDPYREAARLAALPRRDAATSLARLVARLHPTGAAIDNAHVTSLIQLLPKAQTRPDQTDVSSRGPTRLRRTQIGMIIVLAAAVLYLYASAPARPAQDQPQRSPAAGQK